MSLKDQLFATKSLQVLLDEMAGDHRLKRALGPVTLTALGIGAVIGAGIFVATGAAAKDVAGPALMLSYVVAGVTCIFAALCYAEFASMAPVAGSAYTYAYTTMGELFAWIIGWDLVLEYAVGAATVANGWSGYFQSVLLKVGIAVPMIVSGAPHKYDQGHLLPNVVADYPIQVVQKELDDDKPVAPTVATSPPRGSSGSSRSMKSARARNWREMWWWGRWAIRTPRPRSKACLLDDGHAEGGGNEREGGDLGRREPQARQGRLLGLHVPRATATRRPSCSARSATPRSRRSFRIPSGHSSTCRPSSWSFLVTVVLVKGISESAGANAVMVGIKVAAVLFVIAVGAFFINPGNWTRDFAPYGWTGVGFFGIPVLGGTNAEGDPVGVLAGAAIIFFAYIGFDSVSTHAEEAKNPKRDVPIGIIASLVICTVLYIAVVAVLTGMVPLPAAEQGRGRVRRLQATPAWAGLSSSSPWPAWPASRRCCW